VSRTADNRWPGRDGPASVGAVVYRHPLAFLLGLEGVALLRAQAGDGFGRAFTEARIEETRTLLDRAAAALGPGTELGPLSTVEGYRSWSATYDEPGNPLIDVEQPAVQALVSQYLGGVPAVAGPDGRPGLLPAHRHLASDYLTAALDAGFAVRGCAEPRWPASDQAGGPLARQWCGPAADADAAAYTGTPAAIVWHFQRP
jgi:hypothetical protein